MNTGLEAGSSKNRTETSSGQGRPGGETRQEKARKLSSVLPGLLKELATENPTNGKESAALVALRPRAKEILALRERGFSANAIAEAIAHRPGVDAGFTAETLRGAIKTIEAEAKTTTRLSAALSRDSNKAITRETSTSPSTSKPTTSANAPSGFSKLRGMD